MPNSITVNLYRKRLIPNETIHLKDDVIMYHADDLIITKWNTLKPRLDIHHGISAYFITKGFKISKIYDSNHKLVYWYCDIISTQYNNESSSYIFLDLLVDVVVYEDGSYKVLDLLELNEAFEMGLLKPYELTLALKNLNSLLTIIYNNEFNNYTNCINNTEG